MMMVSGEVGYDQFVDDGGYAMLLDLKGKGNDANAAFTEEFYQKMKADYYRYIAEFTAGDAKAKAAQNAENAEDAYAVAAKVAEQDLPVTHHIRHGLVLEMASRDKEVYFAK